MPGDSNILLRIDSETKRVWQERARVEGLSLTGLIIGCVEGVGAGIHASPDAVEVPAPPTLGAGVSSADPSPASTAVAGSGAREEPAPSTPAVPVPPPQRAAGSGKRHLANCPCLMCKG